MTWTSDRINTFEHSRDSASTPLSREATVCTNKTRIFCETFAVEKALKVDIVLTLRKDGIS